MPLTDTDNPSLARDMASHALVTTDRVALLKTRSARERTLKLQQQQQQVERRMQTLHDRLDQCETLLHELVQHVSTLVAKLPASTQSSEE